VALNKGEKEELESVAKELDNAVSSVSGPRGRHLARQAERLRVLAGTEDDSGGDTNS
jgi:heme-degrading monooxygenase HmoA